MAEFKIGDEVDFILTDPECGNIAMHGTVAIVDEQGIFWDNSEPYYDIRTNNGLFVKHIPQSKIS